MKPRSTYWLFEMNTQPSETVLWSNRFVPRSIFQIALYLLGVALIAWAFGNPQFRDDSGFPLGTICLPIICGIALFCLAFALGTAWKRFAFWLMLGLVGQAVTLQMIDAGPFVHYQHYRPLGVLAAQQPWLVLFVFVEAALVAAGLAKRPSAIWSWLRHAFQPWQLIILASMFALAAVALSREVGAYLAELALATVLQLIQIGNLALIVLAIPKEAYARLERYLNRLIGKPLETNAAKSSALDSFAAFAALWVVVIAALLNTWSYQQHPHIADEVGYLLHARILASGTWTVLPPPVPQAFDIYLMQARGDQWFAATPPGWPAVLALGVRLGVPWLVNPILAGINVLLTYLLIQELFNRRMARLVVLLLCASPWFLFMSMNFMTHTLTLTCALGAGVLIVWAKRQRRALWALLAGVLVGYGSLIRPLDGLLVAGLLGLWLLGIEGLRSRILFLFAFGVGAIAVGAAVLPYNQGLTGNPTVFPLNAYLDEQFGPGKNDLGFGENRGYGWALQPFPGHSPLGAVVNAALNLFSVNTELFGWSIGSLSFITLLLVSGEMQRGDYLMLAVIAATVGVFSLYWFNGGPDFGARYWYVILLPCLVLTVRGIQILQKKLDRGESRSSFSCSAVTIAILLLAVMSLLNYVPWRALDKYHHYLRMRPDIQALAKSFPFQNSLVLIRGEAFPDYASAAVFNPLDWNSTQTIYAWEKDDAVRAALMNAYPDRVVWIVEGPSRTQSGYRVVAGPLQARAILQQ